VIATYGHGACSAGFGVRERLRSQSGHAATRFFLLTAAHCASPGEAVARRSDPVADRLERVGVTERSGFDARPRSFDTDAAAIRIAEPAIAPRRIYASPLPSIEVKGAVAPRRGMGVCQSGRASNTVDCGRIVTGPVRVEYLGQKMLQYCYKGALAQYGDSGGPVWKRGTHLAVGLITAGYADAEGNPLDFGCLTPLLPIPNRRHVPAILSARGLGSLHLLTTRSARAGLSGAGGRLVR
jgi:Trypsin